MSFKLWVIFKQCEPFSLGTWKHSTFNNSAVFVTFSRYWRHKCFHCIYSEGNSMDHFPHNLNEHEFRGRFPADIFTFFLVLICCHMQPSWSVSLTLKPAFFAARGFFSQWNSNIKIISFCLFTAGATNPHTNITCLLFSRYIGAQRKDYMYSHFEEVFCTL